MFTLSQFTKKAAERLALKRRATVKMLVFGQYLVFGDAGAFYTVKCWRDAEGRKLVDCHCKAGAANQVCYHAAHAAALHVVVARQRSESKAA